VGVRPGGGCAHVQQLGAGGEGHGATALCMCLGPSHRLIAEACGITGGRILVHGVHSRGKLLVHCCLAILSDPTATAVLPVCIPQRFRARVGAVCGARPAPRAGCALCGALPTAAAVGEVRPISSPLRSPARPRDGASDRRGAARAALRSTCASPCACLALPSLHGAATIGIYRQGLSRLQDDSPRSSNLDSTSSRVTRFNHIDPSDHT
jgi:hypothetical protein